MAQIVTLPSLGFAILEATLLKWLKAEGEAVAKDEPIAQMESDKLTYEVVSPIDGVLLKQTHPVGTVVKVDRPIAVVGQAGESIEDAAPAASSAETAPAPGGKGPTPVPSAPTAASPPPEKVKATPAAKSLCREHGIDIGLIAGTGPEGAVSREDVMAYMEKSRQTPAAPEPVVAASTPGSKEEIIPFSGVRKSIADSLLQSYTNAVHVTTTVEVDMTEADGLRRMLKEAFYELEGAKLSFVPFFIKAALLGLREFPILNAALRGDEIVVRKTVDFSIAVDTPKGLMIPVLKSAEAMSFRDIAGAVSKIVIATKDGDMPPAYFGAGTISLSNAGAYGAVSSTPIIANGQSSVVWTGAIIEKPAVKDGEIAIRKIMNLCVSYDHRIIDGAKVAQFLGVMKRFLENPCVLIAS